MSPVGGVLFDLFETLVSQPPIPPELHPRRRIGCADVFDEVWATSREARMTGHVGFRELLTDVCRQGAIEPNACIIDELVADRAARKAEVLSDVSPLILDMLEHLRRHRVPAVVVSNCAVDEIEHWHRSPLSTLVSATVFSCDCGVMKPDRAIYEIALDRISCDPAAAIFVGDGGSDELRGAHEAGIGTVLRATWFIDQVEDRFGRLAPADTSLTEYATIATPDALIDHIVRGRS